MGEKYIHTQQTTRSVRELLDGGMIVCVLTYTQMIFVTLYSGRGFLPTYSFELRRSNYPSLGRVRSYSFVFTECFDSQSPQDNHR